MIILVVTGILVHADHACYRVFLLRRFSMKGWFPWKQLVKLETRSNLICGITAILFSVEFLGDVILSDCADLSSSPKNMVHPLPEKSNSNTFVSYLDFGTFFG